MDYHFSCLQDASKAHLMMIWLLASQMDNKIPADTQYLQRTLHLDQEIDLESLEEHGFIEIDSEPLAECKQSAELEAETETEAEYKGEISEAENLRRVPFREIVNTYHECLPELPKVEKLTPTRKGFIRQRWLEDLQDLDMWRNYFGFVRRSDFLMGKTDSGNGKPPFRADLEWLTRPGNFAKVAEEKYHHG